MTKATTRPARRSGVSRAIRNSHSAAPSASVLHASPNSNRCLKPMLFHAPVERAAAQPKLIGGQRNVEMMHPQRALDHLLLELVEVEAGGNFRRRHRRRVGSRRQREILGAVML